MNRQSAASDAAVQSASPEKRFAPHARFWLGSAGAKWIAAAIVIVFSIYRLATFVPQPLDAQNTLRPVLNGWFSAFLRMFANPDAAYEDWKQLCFFVLLLPPSLALLDYVLEREMFSLPRWVTAILCSRALFWASIAASLIICRYPTLLDYQLNPDEGEFLSAAHKLFYDPNFFHSVDTGTSGPLNIYPLMLPAVFGLSPDFASSRALVIVVLIGVIYLGYRSLRLLTSEGLSRIAILPIAGAFAAFRNPNLIHYSSEQIPILIVTAAFYCSVRLLRRPAAYRVSLVLLGLLSSVAFFSKMQAVPIVAALAAGSVAYTYTAGHGRRLWRAALLVVAGALPLLILNAILCLAAGVLRDFWISYIVSNQRYVDMQSNFVTDLPRFLQYLLVGTVETHIFVLTFAALAAAYVMASLRSHAIENEQRTLMLMTACAAIVAGIGINWQPSVSSWSSYLSLVVMFSIPIFFLLFSGGRSIGTDPMRWFGMLSTLAIAAAIFSIYKPHRLFPHYLLFLITPVSMAMAWMLIRQANDPAMSTFQRDHAEARPWTPRSTHSGFVMLFVILTVSGETYVWGSDQSHEFRNVVPTIASPEGKYIRSLTSNNAKITIWGWSASTYLSSARAPGTRDLNLFYFFAAPPDITRYYRKRFLRDLAQNPAELFIDGIGPGSWSFTDRSLYNFEQFPEIAAFVASHYEFLADVYPYRYYVRRDLAARVGSVKAADQCAPEAIRCLGEPAVQYVEYAAEASVLRTLPAVEIPSHSLIETKFTPMARQVPNATVFSNESEPNSYRGFRFQNVGGDRYRLIIGLGSSWAFSKSMLFPPGKPVSLLIEIDGNDVYIRANGTAIDDMHLTAPVADSSGTISIRSWIDGQCRFTGAVDFFQILNLGLAD